jgi:hypothetical protein
MGKRSWVLSVYKAFIDSVLFPSAYRDPGEKALPIPAKDIRIRALEIRSTTVDLVPEARDDPAGLPRAVHAFLKPVKKAMGSYGREGIAESSTVLSEGSIHCSRYIRNPHVIAEAVERVGPLPGFSIAI